MNTTIERTAGAGLAAANCSPVMALSIRQPWAWLIMNAGKNIENRTWPTRFRGWFFVHASKGMTRQEYEDAMNWIVLNSRLPLDFHEPKIEELQRGGIIGMAKLGNCVTGSDSPWFCGPFGFVIDEVKPLPFRACKGALGFFNPGNDPGERPEADHEH